MSDQTPNNILAEFQSRRRPGNALDIGSGSGANSKMLKLRGWDTWAIDIDWWAVSDEQVDVRKFVPKMEFSMIVDCNTLCHVENPPYAKINQWLAPWGIFFSIHPAIGTSARVKEGKAYTRLASEHELKEDLKMFSNVRIYESEYPHFGFGEQLKSWIITAEK